MTSYGKDIVCDQINTQICHVDQALGGKVHEHIIKDNETDYDASAASSRFFKIDVEPAGTPAATRDINIIYTPTNPASDYYKSELLVFTPQTTDTSTSFYVANVRTPAVATPTKWPIEIQNRDGTTNVTEVVTLHVWLFASSG